VTAIKKIFNDVQDVLNKKLAAHMLNNLYRPAEGILICHCLMGVLAVFYQAETLRSVE
jgi:hypothetical protein